jgi:hypothetical protein
VLIPFFVLENQTEKMKGHFEQQKAREGLPSSDAVSHLQRPDVCPITAFPGHCVLTGSAGGRCLGVCSDILWLCWGLNLGSCAYKACALPLDLHLSSLFLFLVSTYIS